MRLLAAALCSSLLLTASCHKAPPRAHGAEASRLAARAPSRVASSARPGRTSKQEIVVGAMPTLTKAQMESMIAGYSPWYRLLAADASHPGLSFYGSWEYDGRQGEFAVGQDMPVWFQTEGAFKVFGNGCIYRWNPTGKHQWLPDYVPPGRAGVPIPKLKTDEIQEIVGARTDGKYGPETVRKVKEFQWKLIHLGYLHGKADGIWGSRTDLAYERYTTARHTRKVPTTSTSAPGGTKHGRNK